MGAPTDSRGIAIIIQARMDSARLPGKVLRNIGGLATIEHVYRRCTMAHAWLERRGYRVQQMIATSRDEANGPLVRFCRSVGLRVTAPEVEEDDVLGRYAAVAAPMPDRDLVVRVTGDCPFLDPLAILLAVEEFEKHDVPMYLATTSPTFPAGMDVEIFTARTLRQWHDAATSEAHREHVTLMHREQQWSRGLVPWSRTGASRFLLDRWLAIDEHMDWGFLDCCARSIALPPELDPGTLLALLDWYLQTDAAPKPRTRAQGQGTP